MSTIFFLKLVFYLVIFELSLHFHCDRRLAFVLNFRKIAHAHISGRQNKNKVKEKHVESSEQLVNRFPTSIQLFRICGFWEKYARQLRSIRMYKSKVNYFFTILLYTFSETISWAKNNKMGHC